MGRIIRILSDRVNRICLGGAMAFFGLMLVLVIFQVLSRYIFQAAPSWTAEAIRYSMVWGGMLGATVAFKTDQDPKLIQPPKGGGAPWRILSALIRAASVMIFLGPVLFYSQKFLIRTWHRPTEALGIPSMWVGLAVPFAAAVITLHVAAKLTAAAKPSES